MWPDPSPAKIHGWQLSTWQYAQCSLPLDAGEIHNETPPFILEQLWIKPYTGRATYPWRCGAAETFITCWWECNMIGSLWKSVWQILVNTPMSYYRDLIAGYLSKKNRGTSTQKPIHKCLYWLSWWAANLGTGQIPITCWMDQQTWARPNNGLWQERTSGAWQQRDLIPKTLC